MAPEGWTAVAAWLQAIGGVGAVWAALIVSSRQLKSASTLQIRAETQERRRKYACLTGFTDAALDEFNDILAELKTTGDPVKYFEENSAPELMEEFYQALRQISPLDMPSQIAVRSLVKLRDLLKTAAWNANQAVALYNTERSEYSEYLLAMTQNLAEVARERDSLKTEFAKG